MRRPTTRTPRRPTQDRLKAAQKLLLSAGASELVREGDVLTFNVTHWSRLVELRFTLDPSGRWGCLSRRSPYDPTQLKGTPSGTANLLYAVNAFNRAGLGARLRVWANQLCFERVVLMPRATSKELAAAAESLVKAAYAGIEALRPIREGTNWYAGTRSLTPPEEDDGADELTAIQDRMAEAKLEVSRVDDTLLCQRQGLDVRLTCSRGDLLAKQVVAAAASPRSSIKIKLGEPIPECELLVAELNRLHTETPCTLTWTPKAGVVSGLAVNAASCGSADVELLLDTLVRPGSQKELEALALAVKSLS